MGCGHVSMFTPTIFKQTVEMAGFQVLDFHPRRLFPGHTLPFGLIAQKIRHMTTLMFIRSCRSSAGSSLGRTGLMVSSSSEGKSVEIH